ncbi:MAG: saccharopine dehydrogenase C-terminal domain-containing protein [Gemmatimonadota bacterium]
MKFLVLGAGAQGSAAAFDLLRRPEVEGVILADQRVDHPKPFLKPYIGKRLELRALNAKDEPAVQALMGGVDGVLCALPYYFNAPMTELALESGCHFCDLGGNTAIVLQQRELDQAAQAAGLSVIPDCGLAPGMVNILAQDGMDSLDQTTSVELFVGGLPQHPKPPLNYQVVFSLEGVIDYATTPVLVLAGGKVTEVEPLGDLETLTFEGLGDLEAFNTAGGISLMPYRYQGQVDRMVYKTLRYPGNTYLMRAMRDIGLFDEEPIDVDGQQVVPRRSFIAAVSPHLQNPEGDDLVVLRVDVRGTRNGKAAGVRYELIDYYDAEHGVTAMMRSTGYSLAITALMQADGRVERMGVCTPDEAMPADAYLAELKRSGIEVKRLEL